MYRTYCACMAMGAAISISACGSDDPQSGGEGTGGAATGGAATGGVGTGGAASGGAGAGGFAGTATSGGSGGAALGCADAGGGSSADAGSAACAACMNDTCSAAACWGAGWQSGNYEGGACASYFECGLACCGDQDCLKACVPTASTECQTCIQDVVVCQSISCMSACTGDGGAPDAAG